MSTIKVDTIQDTSGNEQFTAKAWVNFNGSGTVAIRDSGGVSSVVDTATGYFTINFTTSLANANYAVTGSGDRPGLVRGLLFTPDNSAATTFATTYVKVFYENASGGKTDPEFASIIVVGD